MIHVKSYKLFIVILCMALGFVLYNLGIYLYEEFLNGEVRLGYDVNLEWHLYVIGFWLMWVIGLVMLILKRKLGLIIVFPLAILSIMPLVVSLKYLLHSSLSNFILYIIQGIVLIVILFYSIYYMKMDTFKISPNNYIISGIIFIAIASLFFLLDQRL